MNHDEIEYKLKWLQEILNAFVRYADIEEETFTLSVSCLINIVLDVYDDICKIKQFHNLAQPSIAREVSLYCYYILKRKPIIVTDEMSQYASQINEAFCTFLLLNSTENKEIWDKEYIQFLISMFYRGELSKDAIYLLAMTMRQIGKLGGNRDGI